MTRPGSDARRDRRLVRQQLRAVCRELNDSPRVARDRGPAGARTLCTCSTSSPATIRHLRTMLRVRQVAQTRLLAQLYDLQATGSQSRLDLARAEQTIIHLRSELEEALLHNAALRTN